LAKLFGKLFCPEHQSVISRILKRITNIVARRKLKKILERKKTLKKPTKTTTILEEGRIIDDNEEDNHLHNSSSSGSKQLMLLLLLLSFSGIWVPPIPIFFCVKGRSVSVHCSSWDFKIW
jgi:hypothetical protein